MINSSFLQDNLIRINKSKLANYLTKNFPNVRYLENSINHLYKNEIISNEVESFKINTKAPNKYFCARKPSVISMLLTLVQNCQSLLSPLQ